MKKIFSINFFINDSGSYGSVTVFLTMILFPMLLFMITLTDYAKITVAKNQISNAGELTINAALSYYDEYLKDMYGLFAVSKSTEDLQENLENYFTMTLEGVGVDENSIFLKELQSIFSSSEDKKEAYTSLIHLKNQKFSLKSVEGANLTNTSILNNQIMDYMEYRGPLVIAGGILDKISAFRNLKNETKAAQDKVNYEKKLSDIEKLCKEAYQAINDYNTKLDIISQEQLSQKIEQINESYQEAVRYIFLIEKNENAKPVKIEKEENISESDLELLYEKLNKLLREGHYYNELLVLNNVKINVNQNAAKSAEYLYQYNITVNAFNESDIYGYGNALEKILENKKKEINNKIKEFQEKEKDILSEIEKTDKSIKQIIKELKENIFQDSDYNKTLDKFSKNYTKWKNSDTIKDRKKELKKSVEDYYNEMKKAENFDIDKIEEDKKNTIEKIENNFNENSLFNLLDKRVYKFIESGKIKSQINSKQEELDEKNSVGNKYIELLNIFKQNYNYFTNKGEHYEIANLLYDGKDKVKDLIKQGNTARNILKGEVKEILTSCDTAKKAVDDVIKKINDLEDNKTIWQNDINNLSGESKTSMQSDLDEEANMDKGQAQQCSNTLKEHKEMLETLKVKVGNIKFNRKEVEDTAEADSEKELSSRCDIADWYYSENIKIEKNVYENLTPIKIKEDNDDFYKYLKNLVDNLDNSKESEKKKSAKELRDTLLKNDSDSGETSDDSISDSSVSSSDSFLPSKIEGVEKEKETKKTSVDKDNSQNSLESDTDLLKLLVKDIDLKNSLNDVYLTEYIMNMFSYRTYHLKEDGSKKKEDDLKTLSNYDYNKQSILYKAEAEYVLWGKDTAKQNQNAMYTAIFGVRFLMNSIYALTDREINTTTRATAIAIAGFTGFGVPIVKTVLDLGLALLETKSDMDDLIEGKNVAIYKNSSTWKYSIQGAANTVKNEVVKTVAQTMASLAMDKLQECANEQLDRVTNDYINPYLEEMTGNAIDGIINTVTKRIESKLSAISIGDFASDDEIKQNIEQWILDFKSNLGVPDTEPNKSKVSDYILYISYQKINTNGFKEKMTNKVIELRDKADQTIDQKIEEYTEKIENYVIKDLCKIEKDENTGKYKKVFGKDISELIGSATSKVKDEIKNIAAEKTSQAKEKINDKIAEYCDKLPTSKSNAEGLSIIKTTNKSAAKTLTMNYKEYLTMFLLLTGLTKSSYDAHLIRMADLIQINIVQKKKNDGIQTAFTMLDSNTHFKVDAFVSGGTILGGNYYLQESNGMYGISYIGVEGY